MNNFPNNFKKVNKDNYSIILPKHLLLAPASSNSGDMVRIPENIKTTQETKRTDGDPGDWLRLQRDGSGSGIVKVIH